MKIIKTNSVSESDISMYFGSLDSYAQAYAVDMPRSVDVSHFDYYESREYNRQKQLKSASFCLVPSQIKTSQRGRFLLMHLFVRALGMLGSLDSTYSLFYKHQTAGNLHLKRPDKRLIRMHYTSDLKAGMPADAVRNVLHKMDLESILKEKY